MNTLKLANGNLKYREPNLIELFELRAACGWGSDDNGYSVLAKALDYCRKLCENEEHFQKAISDNRNQDALSSWCLKLLKAEVTEDEKK